MPSRPHPHDATRGPDTGRGAGYTPSPWPEPVGECIARIADTLNSDERVVSVVLVGSAARGELVCAEVDGRLEVFGDLEFMAITDRRLPEVQRRARSEEVHALGRTLGCRNRLFHAEVLFREHRRLAKLPPLVFTHELRVCGRVLAGNDVLSEVPIVTADNLDRRNTHEILMKRLWALAEAVPAAWLDHPDLADLPARTFSVAAARNALDIPTVLLPESGVLLPTYAARVAYWAAHPELPFLARLDGAVGGDSAAWLVGLLADRSAAVRATDLAQIHGTVVAGLEAAMAWLLRGSVHDGGTVADAVWKESSRLFHELPISPGEVIGLSRQVREVARVRGFRAAAHWTAAPRKGRLTAALLALHGSLAAWRTFGEAEARTRVESVWTALGPLAEGGATTPATTGFPEQWRNARRAVARAWWRTIRLGDATAWLRIEEALWEP